MRYLNTWLLALLVSMACPVFAVVLTAPTQTPVDIAAPLPPNSGNLSTNEVKPDADEKPYWDKLAPDEVRTGILGQGYSLAGRLNKYVGWYGILRKIEPTADGNETIITVQHTYADGMTDSHMMTVSFHGDGDFRARLKGVKLPLLPNRLVKVYGTVARYDGTIPEIKAEFVKEWDWLNFTFMDYGEDKSNPEWVKLRKVQSKDCYHPYPSFTFYEERLGPAPLRLFEILTPEQQLKYANTVTTFTGGKSPLTLVENVPRYLGKEVTLEAPGPNIPILPAFRTPETFLDFRQGKIASTDWKSRGIVVLRADTRVKVLGFKNVPEVMTAMVSVQPVSGGEPVWVPGFSLKPD